MIFIIDNTTRTTSFSFNETNNNLFYTILYVQNTIDFIAPIFRLFKIGCCACSFNEQLNKHREKRHTPIHVLVNITKEIKANCTVYMKFFTSKKTLHFCSLV